MTRLDAFFLPQPAGRRFCLLHAADAGTARRGALVYVHPFAEEMNKARRMAALQARALAALGFVVLQIDLHGCGDSDGDFGSADWSGWIDDVVGAVAWLRAEAGPVTALWGLRAGCLLAAAAAARLEPAPALLFWQPVASGRAHLQQFLRIKLAAGLLDADPQARAGTDRLRAQLLAGESIEVAGYTLAPALAAGLDDARLVPPPTPSRVAWLEVAPAAPPELSPASRRDVEAWQAAGHSVLARAVEGAAFWQTQEVTQCPALLAATADAVACVLP